MDGHHFTAAQRRQIFFLLRLATEFEDGNFKAPHLRINAEQQPVIFTGVPQPFHRNADGQGIGAATAEFLGDGQALNTELRAFGKCGAIEFTVAVERDHVAGQFVTGEFHDRLLE